ncbi:MAG: HD domain-containing protein [Candidatus Omnitrophota bacterium]|nr:MAG: HD domain-containing protein [Candidatus Omnitrophota bacterium]
MSQKLEEFLNSFISSFQIARMYTTQHPQFTQSIDKVLEVLREVLGTQELVIGIVGEELTTGDEILFDLSRRAEDFILYLKERNIERITFYQGITKEELTKFINCLFEYSLESGHNFQEHLSLYGVRCISVGKLEVSSAGTAEDIRESLHYLQNYQNSLDTVSQSVTSLLDGQIVDYAELKFVLTNAMKDLMGAYQWFLRLAAMKTHDPGTFIHLLNVSILAMHFSSKLGFTRENILEIGLAALFHDIGKMYITHKLIKKKGKLTEEEFAQLKSHTVLGAEILLQYVDVLGVLPLVVAFEHHLRYDSGGYPQLQFNKPPHTASLIVSICDVYDALNQRRAYKQDYSPEIVYDLMKKARGRVFHPVLLDKFFQIMGVWPVGTIVLLSTGKVAVVREENEGDIFFPKVEVVSAPEHELIDLKEKKQDIKITRTLNPLREGKQYLPFV